MWLIPAWADDGCQYRTGSPTAYSKDEQKTPAEGNLPPAWTEAKRRQKDVDTSWTKKHGKNYFGDEISINADKRYKLIRKVVTDTAATHDSQHFDALYLRQ